MKLAPIHLTGRTRRGLCGITLAVSLSTAAAAGPLTAQANPAAPGPDSAQAGPSRGVPNLVLPDLRKPPQQPGPSANGDAGIPATALDAYKKAAQALAASQSGCRIPWELVAGIGRVESVHASGYGLRTDGSTEQPIRGPRLDGKQFALIRDTDGGRWDGDTEYDRAVGPTQFIPSTWVTWGADGNGDGVKDPNNIYDAALGTARYLCAGDRNLTDPADLDKAILSYNNSREYVNAVLEWMRTYQGGKVTALPDDTPAVPHRPDPADGRSVTSADTAVRTSVPAPGAKPQPKPLPQPKPKPKPKPKPEPTPEPEPRPKPDPRTVTRLTPLGEQSRDAETGQDLDQVARVRASNANGDPVPGAGVAFEIVGADTDARFPGHGDATTVTVTTDAQGIAVAPRMRVGDRPGGFVVMATTVGKDVTFRVNARLSSSATADTLTRIGERSPTAPAGGTFGESPQVKATRYGQPALGTVLTATFLTSKENTAENTLGPYFSDASGKTVRTLVLPPPGADGVVTLPAIHTDGNPGTYVLRLTAADGVTLDVELTVTA
ncbi:lytic transglycosylase domain-containing protein [Streptomyces hesseae]|uniref:Lytic transglycosylase domain-containing protein n=1 Tax=Streptomyces hesseae TaxID=3075519 RepID=A0ABU2SX84_9ACTN|nr:lytic transglycosylase domain-containing protein [Streptomyces sp. DSM 40473]MDT0452989.1 lytic transglycosylase domain-containing protein [Streptomyces sp. DSM 40473]